MAGPKVKLKDQLGRVVRLGGDSAGATVGKDLRWPDGSLVKSTEIRNPSAGAGGTGPAATVWRLIREVPANLAALAKVSAAGLLIRRSSGAIEAGTATTDDVPEGGANQYWKAAPADGHQYGQRDGAWTRIEPPVVAARLVRPIYTGDLLNDQPQFVYDDSGQYLYVEE